MNQLPIIIQGGMGVCISNSHIAKTCSQHPFVLGTLSGVAIERVVPQVLQQGDPGGHYRRALLHFPFPEVAERVVSKYFVEGGIPAGKKIKAVSVVSLHPNRELIELMIVANFALVWLAKEGHKRPVSVNYLEKIQIPHIYNITGAIIAGVDYLTMGAGITLQIPAVLDSIVSGTAVNYRVQVEGSKDGFVTISFNPKEFFGRALPPLKRPSFLPIVSTDVLATLMAKKLPAGSIQGFVIEKPTAGGHNAPPRTKGVFDEKGQPIYGPKDEVVFSKLRELGIPFWIAGSCATQNSVAEARALGAVGIQAGSIFALSDDSGMLGYFRNEIRRLGYRGELEIRTDPRASPTGFPFKVVQLPETLSDHAVYIARERVCDVCALRIVCEQHDGEICYRCPGEPLNDFLRKGGKVEDTVDARCLCNGLLAAAGFGNPLEPPIFTLGDDVSFLRHLMRNETDSYGAVDAIKYLLSSEKN